MSRYEQPWTLRRALRCVLLIQITLSLTYNFAEGGVVPTAVFQDHLELMGYLYDMITRVTTLKPP